MGVIKSSSEKQITEETFNSGWSYLKSITSYKDTYEGMSLELQQELAIVQFRQEETLDDTTESDGKRKRHKDDATGGAGSTHKAKGGTSDTTGAAGSEGTEDKKKEDLTSDQLWTLFLQL